MSVAELEPPSEPEPATLAPEGTGNWLGQFGGNWPSRERDTWPLGVETWKFLAVIVGVGLAVVVAGLLRSWPDWPQMSCCWNNPRLPQGSQAEGRLPVVTSYVLLCGAGATGADETPGPMTASMLETQQRALTTVLDSTKDRVSALERYATAVEAADAARRDWLLARKLSDLNDKYLGLLARTGNDGHAIEEINGQAAVAARAYNDSLRQASAAGEALVPPRTSKE